MSHALFATAQESVAPFPRDTEPERSSAAWVAIIVGVAAVLLGMDRLSREPALTCKHRLYSGSAIRELHPRRTNASPIA